MSDPVSLIFRNFQTTNTYILVKILGFSVILWPFLHSEPLKLVRLRPLTPLLISSYFSTKFWAPLFSKILDPPLSVPSLYLRHFYSSQLFNVHISQHSDAFINDDMVDRHAANEIVCLF